MSTQVREEVLKVMHQKDKIEDEIKELTSILTKNGVGMNEPLVDSDGFPINSIDVYQVRHARHRIICLQNDHKALMKQIEGGLQSYYGAANESGAHSHSQDVEMHENINRVIHKTPFAKVNLVSPGSPAEYSNLEQNDLIVEFGSVNATNFRNIMDVATVVQHSEGQHINIKLKRGERYVVTTLIPKKWSGKGLLGCNIVPLDGTT